MMPLGSNKLFQQKETDSSGFTAVEDSDSSGLTAVEDSGSSELTAAEN